MKSHKEKAVSGSMSLYPPQWEYLGKFPEGKSKYVQGLLNTVIEGGDITDLPSFQNGDCLVNLAKQFTPFVADDVAKQCEGADQKKLLAAILINFAGGDYSDPNENQLSPSFKKALKKHGFTK